MLKRFGCLILLLLVVPAAWATDDSLWNDALTKIDSGDLAQATVLLNQLLTDYPASPKAPGAQLKLALVKALDEAVGDTGGGVFISLWEDPTDPPLELYEEYSSDFTAHWHYPSLAVKGEFDSIANWANTEPPNPPADELRYLFNNLKNRILNGE